MGFGSANYRRSGHMSVPLTPTSRGDQGAMTSRAGQAEVTDSETDGSALSPTALGPVVPQDPQPTGATDGLPDNGTHAQTPATDSPWNPVPISPTSVPDPTASSEPRSSEEPVAAESAAQDTAENAASPIQHQPAPEHPPPKPDASATRHEVANSPPAQESEPKKSSSRPGKLLADSAEVARTIEVLFEPGDTIELRVPRAGRDGTVSGYFNDQPELVKAILSLRGDVPAIYATLNPVVPVLLARAANRIERHAKVTTSGKDIVCRRNLLIDPDPVRPTGISSTDAEHEAALERARDIRLVLREEYGWPDPILGDSGNGGHLVYRIDLPNDDESTALIQACLKALAQRFDDTVVKIDTSVYDPNRISKVYGTVVRKGDNMPERPHRLSRILELPPALETVTREQLEVLARSGDQTEGPPRSDSKARGARFDIEHFIANYLKARDPVAHEGGRKWLLEECPFNPDHTAPDAAVFQRTNGSLGFRCLHATCADKGWKELRERFEPQEGRHSKQKSQQKAKQPPPLATFEFETGRNVFEHEDEPAIAIIEGLFWNGLTLLVGRPKSGKSWLTLQAAIAVACGKPLAGWLRANKGRVLYLALEEPRQRTTARMRKLYRENADVSPLEDIRFVYKIAPMLAGGAAELDEALTNWPADLVIIDTMRAFARIQGRKEDIVDTDYAITTLLREIAQKHRCAIVAVDHTRKAPGDLIDTVMGTTGVTAGCDAVCGMERTTSGDVILTARGRDHEEVSYSLRFNGKEDTFGWEIFGSGDDAKLSAEREEIIELLRNEAPQTAKQVAYLLRKNANTIRGLMWRMALDGSITKQSNGYVLSRRST